jgi:Holliday junction resolvase RusA-like endonuclease
MIARFFVTGVPKAMSVGKAVRVPNPGGGFRQFQTRRNTEWAVLVGQIGRAHAPAKPLTGPMIFTARFYLPRPTCAPRHLQLPLKRPDWDNLCHKLTDQWNGVFWIDDSQIVDAHLYRRFAADGRVGCEFTIEEFSVAQLQGELMASTKN